MEPLAGLAPWGNLARGPVDDQNRYRRRAERRGRVRLAHRRSTGRDPAEGFGLVIKEDYQIDLAVDLSDPVSTVSFSIVKFF